MKSYILLILCLLLTTYIKAQEKRDGNTHTIPKYCDLSGQIINQKNNRPIEFAMVYLPESKLWTVSNQEGKFTVYQVPVGKINVQVSIIGYKAKELETDLSRENNYLKIVLQKSNLMLDEVVVTAQSQYFLLF